LSINVSIKMIVHFKQRGKIMKKQSQLVLVSCLCLSLNGYAVGMTVTSCTHGGVEYALPNGSNGSCPDMVGGTDAGYPASWPHYHSADNTVIYTDDPATGYRYTGSPGHCEIAKKQSFEDTGR
jgi:hypothetical protein